MASASEISIILMLVTHSRLIDSAKIVALPLFGGSQYMGMKQIGQELVRRGHEFSILVSSDQKVTPPEGIINHVYHVPFEANVGESYAAQKVNEDTFKSNHYYGNLSAIYETFCDYLINSTQVLQPLKDYDLLITDCSMHACGLLLSDYLDVKRVEYCPGPPRLLQVYHGPFNYEGVSMVSYVPAFMSVLPGKMNFFQRMKNLLNIVTSMVYDSLLMLKPVHDLREKYNIKPEKSLFESSKDIELALFVADFALEHAYPIPPNYKMIGPLNIQPVKPLPPDLQQLIDSSGDDGAIIVSFGSNIAAMSKDKVDIMAEAFGRLKQKVIWRLKGYIPSSLSSNIKPVSWLPQNDLLSNEKLRLFVSHVGQNSLYEAAYYGVPLVGIPLFSDQFDNTLLMESRNIGLSVDFRKLTADKLHSTIEYVIKEASYRENAQRISRLMQDRPRSPVQEAGDWIEYALRHESLAHLRPYSGQLAWYQYFLLDVAVFLVLVVLVVIMLIKYTVRLMYWTCCQRRKKEKSL